MPATESKVNEGWRRLVSRYGLDTSKDLLEVSSEQLNQVRNEIGGVDARNMVKFDTRERTPPFLRDLGYFVLPTQFKSYVLVRGEGFHDLEHPPKHPKRFASRSPLAQESPTRGGESAVLDYAFNSGLIEAHFGLGSLLQTARGRRRSPRFKFTIGEIGPIEVSGVQLELDAGYESLNDFVIVEAKIGRPGDFNLRQLFYPYRSWQQWLPGKALHPTFVSFESHSSVFTFWRYEFNEPERYGPIELKSVKSYTIGRAKAGPYTLDDVLRQRSGRQRPRGWDIPQADDFEKVADFPLAVARGAKTSAQMASVFDFDPRQSSYYRHAAEILGLVTLAKGNRYELTPLGRRFAGLSSAERSALAASLVMSLPVTRKLLDRLSRGSASLTKRDIAAVIEASSNVNGTTARRRAATIFSWLKWVSHRLRIFRVEGGRVSL